MIPELVTLVPKYYLPSAGGSENFKTRLALAIRELGPGVRIVAPLPSDPGSYADCDWLFRY